MSVFGADCRTLDELEDGDARLGPRLETTPRTNTAPPEINCVPY
jgi:hypothetical protein